AGVADGDRRGRGARAPEVHDHLRRRGGGAAVRRDAPPVGPEPHAPRRPVHVRGPRRRAEGRLPRDQGPDRGRQAAHGRRREGRPLMRAHDTWSRLRSSAAIVLAATLVLPPGSLYAQRARGGGGGRGSVRSVNRNPSGNGGSWSGPRTSGSTSKSYSGDSSSRTTNVQTRSGQSATGTRNV